MKELWTVENDTAAEQAYQSQLVNKPSQEVHAKSAAKLASAPAFLQSLAPASVFSSPQSVGNLKDGSKPVYLQIASAVHTTAQIKTQTTKEVAQAKEAQRLKREAVKDLDNAQVAAFCEFLAYLMHRTCSLHAMYL
jgi:hypothetical protein